jgi:hypothetical protein
LLGGGVLALAFLGILGVVLYFVFSQSGDQPAVADSSGTDTAPAPFVAPNNPNPIPAIPRGRDRDDPAVFNPIPPATNLPARKLTLTFKGVPTPDVAKFIEERLKSGLAVAKDDFGRAMDGGEPRGFLQGELKHAGVDATATVQTNPKCQKRPQEILMGLDLGVVTEVGDAITIEVNAPPEPSRLPPDKIVGTKLPKAQIKSIIIALSDPNNREREQALKLLQASDPSDDNRATIRQLLRLVIDQKDVFRTDDAIRALGTWGNDEDAIYLTTRFPADVFGTKEAVAQALGKLRCPQTAVYLTQSIANFHDGGRSFNALRAIGTSAEKAVAAVLTDEKKDKRIKAAQFLKDYGSGASIKALQVATQDSDREVAKAAWDAWKTIAFHNPKPAAAAPTASDPPKVVDKPTTETLDDLKVTTLSRTAAEVLSLALAPDGKSYYTMERDGTMKRFEWDGAEKSSQMIGPGALYAVGADGVIVTAGGDARVHDLNTLSSVKSAPAAAVKRLSAASGASVAVLRSESPAGLYVLDTPSLVVRIPMPDAKIKNYGKAEPTITPDGVLVFTRDGGRLCRWKITGAKLVYSDTSDSLGANDGGQIVVSPDSKYVALFYPDGNTGAAKPGTLVYAVGDLKKPAFTIDHGAKASALTFDYRGGAFAGSSDGTLTRFGPNGAKLKSYKLGGPARQIACAPDGDKVMILTDTKLLRVDLPK